MKVKIKAPEGYKYRDKLTGRDYSEIVIDEKKRGRFALVPETDKPVEM